MAAQGVQDHSTDNPYENQQSVQFNAYENNKVRVNQGSARSQKHEQETDSNGKTSRVKTALLVICLIVTIACAVATIVLFTKMMNNEELHTQLNSLSTNFNITIEKVRTIIQKQQDMIQDILLVASCAQTTMNGVYTATSGGRVYCSNGWTVFQKRMDGSIPDFHTKTWEEYSQGFGNLNGEFWLGLRKLHEITRQGGCRLRVDLQSFDKDAAYAEYSQFSVANESNLFRLTVGGYNGTAGDSLSSWHNGMAFSTNERDNDKSSSRNCAKKYHSGGWWNNDCFYAAPNGIYGETRPDGLATMWWKWKANAPMKFIEMGVRCD